MTSIGDVFLIPLDDTHCAGGQVVGDWNGELYLAIFDTKFLRGETPPSAVVDHQPALLALSLDAKLWHGHWPTIGNVQTNLDVLPQPAFKVRQNGTFHIESRDRTVSRPAAPGEADQLLYRTVHSAAALETIVKAYFGIGDWLLHYDELLARNAFLSSSLL